MILVLSVFVTNSEGGKKGKFSIDYESCIINLFLKFVEGMGRRGCKGKGGGKEGGSAPTPGSGSSMPSEDVEGRFKRQTEETNNAETPEQPEAPEKPDGNEQQGPPQGCSHGPHGRGPPHKGGHPRPPHPPHQHKDAQESKQNSQNNNENVQQGERSKRQAPPHEAGEFDEQHQQEPSVWQEVLQIMGDGVKKIFKSVAEKFHEHEQNEHNGEMIEEESSNA
jgi:hypothetical protein